MPILRHRARLLDGTAHGGHLIEAIVRPTLEVYFSILPMALERELDESTKLPLINLIRSEVDDRR